MAVKCTSKSTSFMPKENRVQQSAWNRAAIYLQIWQFCARASGLNGICDNFLSNAMFAFDEDWCAAACGLGRDRQRRSKRRRGADDFLKRQRLADFFGQWVQFAQSHAFVRSHTQCGDDPFGRDRL